MKLRAIVRSVAAFVANLISFGDLLSFIGAALIFYGTLLVYGLGHACVIGGIILIIMAYLGELVTMAALLIHGDGKGTRNKSKRE